MAVIFPVTSEPAPSPIPINDNTIVKDHVHPRQILIAISLMATVL
jgi:hypothetical protein